MGNIKIELYREYCCDVCNKIIHNHIDCPICGKEYASTDAYYDIYERACEAEVIIQCEECSARFKLINKKGCYDDWEWQCIEIKESVYD